MFKLKSMLSDSPTVFKTLFHTASEGIMIVDQEGVILKANPAAQKMFGYENSLEGKVVEDLIPDHLTSRHKDHRKSYNSNPQTRTMGGGLHLQGKKADGSSFPVEISLSPTCVGDKAVVMAFVVDITERRNRENNMVSMGRIFDNSINEIYLFAVDNLRFTMVNQAAQRNLGYSSHELSSMTITDIISMNRDDFLSTLEVSPEEHPKIVIETTHKRKDLTTYPVEMHIQTTVFDDKPTYLAVVMDISERKFAEDQLRKYSQALEQRVQERTEKLNESQKLYHAIARNFPDGTINVFDRDLRYVFVEGKELYTLGIDSHRLIGTRYIKRLAPEVAAQTERELLKVFDGNSKTINIRHKQNDYVLEAVPLPSGGGEIEQILVIEKNVTVQKKMQDKIQRNLERERELNELKSRFVSMASHEFRTPLSTIMSSASLLNRYTEGEQQGKRDKHINRIKSSVHNLTGILNDFLSLDKLETGGVACKALPFDLPNLMREVSDQIRPTLKKGQSLNYSHHGSLQVVLDPHLLNNILINLLSNASKYSPEGSEIQLNSEVSEALIMIEVRDKGIGISWEDQQHLFERFFRAQNAMNIQGTGLGLNIVKKYLDLMNGEIEFSSELGEGSTFTITFDRQPEP